METSGYLQVLNPYECRDGLHRWPPYVGYPDPTRMFDGWHCLCKQKVLRLKVCEYGGEHLVQEPVE